MPITCSQCPEPPDERPIYIFYVPEDEFLESVIVYLKELSHARYIPTGIHALLSELDLSSDAHLDVFIYTCSILKRISRKNPLLLTIETLLDYFAACFIISYSMLSDLTPPLREWADALGKPYSERRLLQLQRKALLLLRWEILISKRQYDWMCREIQRTHASLGYKPPTRSKQFNYRDYRSGFR